MNQPIAPHRVFDVSLEEEPPTPPIGELLVRSGCLNGNDVARIRERQHITHSRFGAAAVDLGLATADDVRHALGEQYGFPSMQMNLVPLPKELVCAVDPTHIVAEAIRRLRTQLLLRWRQSGGPRCVAIISTDAGEGKTFMSANLAIAFAQLNLRTVLVDADLRAGRLERLFGAGEGCGLSGLLIGRSGLDGVNPMRSHQTLSVIGSGPIPPNPQELLSSPRFPKVIESLSSIYEVVIVDTPAWSVGADAQIVTAGTTSAILVSRPSQAVRRSRMMDLIATLRDINTEVMGVLVNRI